MARQPVRKGGDPHEGPSKTVPAVLFPTWAEFEDALASVLTKMAVDTYLIISRRQPDDSESDYYVQFAQTGREGFRAEAVSNRSLKGRMALSPKQEEQIADLGWQFPSQKPSTGPNFSRDWPMLAPFREVASLAIRTLREIYGTAETSELLYKCFARGGHEFAQPELRIDSVESDSAQGTSSSMAPTLADLKALVETALRQLLAIETLTYDEDGDLPVRFGSAMVFVRLIEGQPPIVRLFSPVVWGIAGSVELLAAINDINTRIQFGRVVWTGREVMASIELPAFHLAADDIGFACLQLGNMADHFDGALQERFGGTTMFGPSTGRVH